MDTFYLEAVGHDYCKLYIYRSVVEDCNKYPFSDHRDAGQCPNNKKEINMAISITE